MRNLINSAAATAMCAMIAASVAPTQAAAGVVGMGDQAKIGARVTGPAKFTTAIITGIITTIHIMCIITITATITVITRIITILGRRWSEQPRPRRPSRSGVGDIPIIGDLRRW